MMERATRIYVEATELFPMQTAMSLTLAAAERLVDWIQHVAETDGNSPVTVAVSNLLGKLVVLRSMDGAPELTVNVALAKLKTAKLRGKGNDPAENVDPANWGTDGVTAFAGCVVLTWQGQPVGYVAVSGRKEREDRELALKRPPEWQS